MSTPLSDIAAFERALRAPSPAERGDLRVDFLPDGAVLRFVDPHDGATYDIDARTGARGRTEGATRCDRPALQAAVDDPEDLRVDAPYGPPRSRPTPRLFDREVLMAGKVPTEEMLAPDGRRFVFVEGGDLWLRATADGLARRLTLDGDEDRAWDVEPGPRGPWSPDSLRLFAIRWDRTAVPRWPILHVPGTTPHVTWQRMQSAGVALDRAEPAIVSALDGSVVPVALPDTDDRYVRSLGWRPGRAAGDAEIWLAVYTRTFDAVDIVAVTAASGDTRVVHEESSSTFVQLQHDVLWGGDCGFTWLPSGDRFLWIADREGDRRLYAHDVASNRVVALSESRLCVRAVLRVDDESAWFSAGEPDRPYDTHVFRCTLDGARCHRVTEGAGTHTVSWSPDGSLVVDAWSSATRPPSTHLRRADGTHVAVLFDASAANPPRPVAEEFEVLAADGRTTLRGVLYRPARLVPGVRYPLLEYVYGGPQIHNLPVTFHGNAGGSGARSERLMRALAASGACVVVVAARGTPWRGKAFQDHAYGDWAGHVVADHAIALTQVLAARPWLDPERVGVYGRSWGGHFAFRFLAERPDLFKAAVSVVPGFDPHAGILYEPYLGMPRRHPDAYEAASPFKLAPKVRGALLLVGGLRDIATYADVLRMHGALVEAGVHHDLMLVPNQPHTFAGAAAREVEDRTLRFFREHLGAAAEPSRNP